MNKSIKRYFDRDHGCVILSGDKRSGKSTLLALFADVYVKRGYKVFCQYPYKDCYQIPMVKKKINGVMRSVVDKEWLYSSDLTECCVLIDEGKNVWPARGWKDWSSTDDDFFDFLGKTHTMIVICTLSYDQIDVNVKRAADELIHITPVSKLLNLSYIECSRTTQAKVSDKQLEVLGRSGKQGMRKVNWEIVEVPTKNSYFRRKPYYGKFITEYIPDAKPAPELISWNSLFDTIVQSSKTS